MYKLNRIIDIQGVTNGDTDQIGLCWTTQAGNCSGVTNWIEYDPALKTLWRRINTGIDEYSIEAKEQYAAKDEIGYLFHIVNGEWRWPSIVLGSKSNLDGEFNQVNVLEAYRSYRRIETIPVLADYSHLSVATHPHLFMRTWCTNKVGKTYDTKAGIIYQPIISPEGRVHARGTITGMWLRSAYLGESVGGIVTPPPPPPPPPIGLPYSVVTVRRTAGRQQPNINSASMGVIAAERWLTIYTLSGDWGYTGTRNGWVLLSDTKR